MEEFDSSYEQSRILQNEAHDNPWIMSSIIERELALDEIVAMGGMSNASEELRERFNNASQEVFYRKELMGLPEYRSDPTDR